MSFICEWIFEMDLNEHIDKYLSKEASAEEIEALLNWVKESKENEQEFSEACQLWHSLHNGKFNETKAYEFFEQQTAPKHKTISIWKTISAVAAVALLAIGCFSIFNHTNVDYITIANKEIAVKTVTLPDGSSIYLQKNSSVTYPAEFDKKCRKVKSSGNIFCEIFHDESTPFSLTNNGLTVRVLGTSFLVNTSDSVYVIVETGKVSVSKNNKSVIIEKGERADLRDGNLTATTNNDINFLSWKTGVLQFRNTNLKKVLSDLSRHYNCEFNYTKDCADVQNFNLTGTYQDLQLSQVLQMIELSIPEIHYEINGNDILVGNKK